jgi:hypothetical protein
MRYWTNSLTSGLPPLDDVAERILVSIVELLRIKCPEATPASRGDEVKAIGAASRGAMTASLHLPVTAEPVELRAQGSCSKWLDCAGSIVAAE